MDDTDNQEQNNQKVAHLQPFQWKKGQSGNPAGRPKGKTMKEYAREMLECLTDEERQEFLNGLPKEIIWKMAEGNPESKTDVTSGGKPIIMVAPEIADKHELNTSTEGDS